VELDLLAGVVIGRANGRLRRVGAIALAVTGLVGGASVLTAAPAAANPVIVGGLDLDRACRLQYNWDAHSFANGNAWSWRCYAFGQELGGIDMDRECHVEYGIFTYAVPLDTSNRWSWRCIRDIY